MYPTHGHGISYNPSSGIGYDGTSTNPIVHLNYPGEIPILDGSNVTSPSFTFLYVTMILNVDWVEFHGLHFRNFKQISGENPEHVVQGVYTENCTNITWNRCVVHDMGGIGWLNVGPSIIAYINCDAYNCCDSLGHMPGNYGSGFSSATSEYTGHIKYIGCRAWNCSDQGFGTQGQKSLVSFESCWSFNNGSMSTGGGHGFKLGYMSSDNISSTEWVYATLQNCIAAYNREDGFTTNDNGHPSQRMILNNNIAYHNGHDPTYTANRKGFNLYIGTGSRVRVLKNNISFDNYDGDRFSGPIEHSNNSWDTPGVTVDKDDFVSLNPTELTGSRQNDGSLPNTNFLKLKSDSDLINKGTIVGLPFNGPAPDLGWYESSYEITSTPRSPDIPAYVSSVIQNATPARLEITYNLTLANIIPAPSAFSVKVNNETRTVSSVTVSGTKVSLTLSSPAAAGDTVTVVYTKPASNPVQTAAGGQADSFTARNVTNNVSPVNQPPTISIASPTKSNYYTAPATITIETTVSDPDGNLNRVEFYQGTTMLGALTSVPYSFIWKEVPEGTYSLTAVAVDNLNLRNVSSPVTIIVEKSATVINQLPLVSISVSNKNKPKKHDNLIITADATDPDGTISKVVLKNGDVVIEEKISAPYVFTLPDVDTGRYDFQAIAYDNLGASNIATLEVFIDDNIVYNNDLLRIYPNPNNGTFNIDLSAEESTEENILSIIRLNGKQVFTDHISGDILTVPVSLNDITPGTYIVILAKGKEIRSTRKFIKY